MTAGARALRGAVARAAGAAPQPAMGVAVAVAAAMLAAAAVALHGGATPWRVLTLLLIAPFAEEALLRSGLQETLLRRRWAPAAANAVTAAAFAAAHALARGDAPAAALVLVLPALALGRLYERRRRLRDCVLAHAVLNAAWIVALWLAPGALP